MKNSDKDCLMKKNNKIKIRFTEDCGFEIDQDTNFIDEFFSAGDVVDLEISSDEGDYVNGCIPNIGYIAGLKKDLYEVLK